MKRCPTCNRSYTDENLSFCIDDGTPLVPVAPATDASRGRTTNDDTPSWKAPAYQPPSDIQPAPSERRRVWPWVVGIFSIFLLGAIGLGIAAMVLLPRLMRDSTNDNRPTIVTTVEPVRPENLNSGIEEEVQNSDEPPKVEDSDEEEEEETKGPPTDPDKVLADLKELENEWTVANINADKKALARILADDYVGRVGNGKPHGKAEYLRTITRDTSIQSWDFQDLKVDLKGDRATLTGVLQLQLENGVEAYRFTDKFVWRDRRWQAVSSEVSRIEQVST